MVTKRKNSKGPSSPKHFHHQQQQQGSSPRNEPQQQQHKPQQQQYYVSGPSTAGDVVLGVVTQVARKYLFIDVKRRAMIYFGLIFALSCIAEVFTLPDHYYFVQKNNIFNRYGTKLGWFWLCILMVPFIWLTSLLHHGSRRKSFRDLTRLVVATFQWYFWTNSFVDFERRTGVCHGAKDALRGECTEKGGKWIPGLDISGHTFILFYSILLIGEEACSFRNWPAEPRWPSRGGPTGGLFEYQNFRASTRVIQVLFVAIFFLHLLWDFQLVITLLYYHTITHKLLGAAFAVFCWAVTYRFWYPMAFPFSPIRRHFKTFETK